MIHGGMLVFNTFLVPLAFYDLDIIGNKREDLSFQRKLESRTKHPFEKLDSCLRRNDKQFISNSRYLGFG
jgi:hypothetical protein